MFRIRIRYYLLLAGVILSHIGIAQNTVRELLTNTPPPPNAAGLGKFGEVPVGTYTGIPEINIPLYELKGRELSLPISLTYHAGGLKVEEISSWVGAGWSLNAGGAISRSINGFTDFKSRDGVQDNFGIATPITYGNFGVQVSGRWVPKGILTDCSIQREDNTVDDSPNNVGYISDMLFENYWDTEPDMFYFNFGGLSGKFFFDENRIIRLNQPVDLDFEFYPQKDEDHWAIKTLNGTVYTFGGEVRDAGNNEVDSWIEWTRSHFPRGMSVSTTQASTWYLRSIISTSGERIDFKYEREMYEYSILSGGASFEYDTGCEPAGTNCSTPSGYASVTKIETEGLFLKEILLSYPDSSSTIVRFISANDRLDGDGNPGVVTINNPIKRRLDKIQVIEKSSSGVETVLREFRLAHEKLSNKLWLTSVQEVGLYQGTASKPPYSFDYYEHEAFPNRTSKASDLWGYYNGKDGNMGFTPKVAYDHGGFPHSRVSGSSKEPSEIHAKYGVLTKINYPTGGYTQFEYENNRAKNFSVYKRQDFGDLEVCRGYSAAVPCNALLPVDTTFSIQASGDYEFDVDIIHPYTSTPAVKVCRKYLVSGYATSCHGTSDFKQPFTVSGTEHDILLTYSITGSQAGQPANSILIKRGAVVEEEISISKGYASSGTINLNLPPGDYEISANAINVANHEVWGDLVKQVYEAPNPTYIVKLSKDGTTIEQFTETGNFTQTLGQGKYKVEIVQIDRQVTGAKAQCLVRQLSSEYYTSDLSAGLRVKRVRIHDGMDSGRDIIKRYEYIDSLGVSTGVLMRKPVTYYTTAAVYNNQFGDFCYFNTYGSSSVYPLSTSASGNFVGYGQVNVYYGENGENGKSTFEYSNYADGTGNNTATIRFKCSFFSVGGLLVPGTPGFSYAHKNGNLKQQIDYKNDQGVFKMVNRVVNTYNETFFDTHGLKITSLPLPPSKQSLWDWNPSAPCGPVMYKHYKIRTGFSRLDSSKVTVYDNAGRALQTTSGYEYYSNHLPRWQSVKDSDGVWNYTHYSYLNGTDLIQEERKSLGAHDNAPIFGRATEYEQYRPKTIFFHELLLDGGTPDSETGIGIFGVTNYKKRVTYEYDSYKNPSQQEVDGHTTAFIWNANKTQIIAKIENASYDTSGNLKDRLGNSYSSGDVNLLSFFTGTTAEFLLKFQALRQALPAAEVTAYTHQKGVGVTSITDNNGLTTYYKYDPLGRLELTRDQDNNIVSRHSYKYSNE